MNGVNTTLATQFISSTQLTAVVPAALLTSIGNANIFVQTITGDISNPQVVAKTGSVPFTVFSPNSGIVDITALSPASAKAGSADQVLTVTGDNFSTPDHPHKENRVVWSANGDSRLPTAFVSSTQLTATVPASLLAKPGTYQVRVEIWDVMGDSPSQVSNSLNFVVTP
jgi:hypothetical protein